jgi:cystathionine beta-lyase/cystathionine gamma-synthase
MIDKIFHNEFLTLGGILSPFNAWLIIRGLRTMPVRLERISNTTKEIIRYLENLSAISEIYYPEHSSHPQQELAARQMKMGSGLFSIKTKTNDIAKIEAFCNSLTYWRMAVSWGGFESLIIPSCTFVRPGLYNSLPANLIRFSVGLEDPATLINDLDKAMTYL